MESLGGEGKGQILDVGPICGDNINFFAHRVKRLCVCDMFYHLDKKTRSDDRSEGVWQLLDYPEESLDGILLWDLMDRLEDHHAEEVVKRCYSVAKSGGTVMMLAQGERTSSKVVNSFVVVDDFRLYLRPQQHLDLPLHMRRNRQMMDMLAPFTLLTSFIYRNGTREFVFRRF